MLMESFIGQEHVLGVNTAALKNLTFKTFRFQVFFLFLLPPKIESVHVRRRRRQDAPVF